MLPGGFLAGRSLISAASLRGVLAKCTPIMDAVIRQKPFRRQGMRPALPPGADIAWRSRQVCFGSMDNVHCKRAINQDFIDLFGQRGFVLVPHL